MIEEDALKTAVAKIVEEIDKSTLLGAAFDCMSDQGKLRFQNKMKKIIQESVDV